MATDVTMPRLSDSMEEGTILKWLVSEGDEVQRGQELVEIETDKANMTYESDTAGVLIEFVVGEGETVALGEVIARIGEAGEKAEGKKEEGRAEGSGDGAKSEEPAAPTPAAAPPAKREASENGAGERVKASPVARRMAQERGLDLATITGSGPGGRIVKADVESAEVGAPPPAAPAPAEPERAPEPEPTPAPQPVATADAGNKGEVQVQELTRLQRTVSRRMAESKATAPDFTLEVEIDMSLAVELRSRLKEMTDKPPSFNDMVVRACGLALRDHPRVNGSYKDGRFELYSRINIGVAVAAQDALVVPTVFDADKKSLGEIARTVRDLATKVRDGTITPPELSGGTFTVSNLGMYGIDSFTAVINPPQAALLAVGALKKKPVVDADSGRIVARDMMSATLVSDHRILYGADAAQFLARVRQILEQPLALTL
jgi:pyruvate dehydrogenase E2 component (dihydrolipoamide acetyltransferase)